MWFDSHCHLDFPSFEADRELVWARARAAGVTRAFVPGVSLDQWANLERLQERHVGVRVGVGLHPYRVHESSDLECSRALDELPGWLDRLGAVAVGECGLDRPRSRRGGAAMERQLALFEAQLALARELRAPVVVHVVGAHGTALETLERFGPLPAGGVLHSYSGPAEFVPRYARLGFSFGFSASVCRERARKVKEALRVVPLERLLLETDAPDQPPPGLPREGEVRNEPSELVTVARAVASLLAVSERELARTTSENAERLFRFRRAAR